ncbi:uncharacterized protein B0H18DRAFT_439257 [Fomitopsis serialis]|uniref:uncharacterized protein n=1 Tax=Fomitopsis serialis TaxID=139415 RepID=UPI00200836CE|nr:uncharacterized protein B0H18DRAFT_439257 [Neoantrodia serialis]KAH9924222.1 hypothetical protein B0H18DRAFT_439257 [Neoantrodia serialis]
MYARGTRSASVYGNTSPSECRIPLSLHSPSPHVTRLMTVRRVFAGRGHVPSSLIAIAKVATAKLLAPLILRWLERVPSCLQPITMLDNVAPCLVHAEDRAVDVTRESPKTHGRACRRRRRSVRWKAICRVFAGPVAFEDCTTRLPRASPAHSSRIVLIARRHGPARRTAMCRVFDGRVAFQPRGRSEETAVTSRATDDETFMVEVAVVL